MISTPLHSYYSVKCLALSTSKLLSIIYIIRAKEKRKAKEEFAENNMRGSLGCWEGMARN
jgi:hypothetical protein